MEKRDFADMVIYFCQKVSEMNISRKCKMELLGMITAIEMKHDELMPKWIPVTEALPEPWKEVLTTYEYNGKRYVQTAEYAGQNDENGHPLFCAYSDEFAPDHYDFVYVAWMPLPESYRGEMMNKKEIAEFVKSRDEAFISFVQTDSLAKFFKHCAKYGVELPEDSDVMKAGILKAVQECTDIPNNIKMLAAEKSIRLGFKPFVNWDE